MLKAFEILEKLGEGAFSTVYKVLRKSDSTHYALKKVKLPELKSKEKENALNEVRLLASVRDPNIICYKQAFYDNPSTSLCIVMEYADGGDLLQKISTMKKEGKYIEESEIWEIAIQIVKGRHYF